MKIKVLTLNIFEGGLFFQNILTFIKREQPDIFCLQEVYNGITPTLPNFYQSVNVLQTAFPEYTYFYSPEFLSITVEGKIDCGNVIFSRYPILEKNTYFFQVPYGEYPQVSPIRDYSQYPQNMQHAVIDVGNTHLNVFNVHGIWGNDGIDNPARLQMSKVITKHIKNKKNTILVGDFNVQAGTKTIDSIENNLINVFKNQLQTSFNLQHKDLNKYPGYATAVVDMFFVSQDITVLDKNVPTDDVSDHLPLLCELEISQVI